MRKGNAFEIKWKRAKDVRSRTGSRSITHPEVVVGRIEVVLPCVIVSGSLSCATNIRLV